MIKDLEIRQQQQKKKQLNSPQDKNKNKNYLKKRIEEFLKK